MGIRYFHYYVFPLLAALVITSCNDKLEDGNDSVWKVGKAQGIGFNVDLSQDWQGNAPANRAILQKSKPRNLRMSGSNGTQAWMQENIVSAISNEAKLLYPQPMTRGVAIEEVSQMSNSGFSTFCFNTDDNSLYYGNLRSNKDGSLTQDKIWIKDKGYRFFAVHPYDENNANFDANSQGISYNFTVNGNVEKQEDLMYASTGPLGYNASGIAPLHFRHALAAITFSLGDNPDFGKKISSITLKNVNTKGTYTLPAKSTAVGSDANGTWSNIGTVADITLDGLDMETTGHANAAITSLSQAFLMLPHADLTGIQVVVRFDDGSTLSHTFDSGKWEAGYTYDYKISKKEDSWQYSLSVYPGNGYTLNYDDERTYQYYPSGMGWYGVQSYKTADNSATKVPVPWNVVKYEYSNDGGETWIDNGTQMPEWLLSFADGGEGSSSWEAWYIEVDAKSYIGESDTPESAARNALIRSNPVRTDWDLSTHDIKGNSIAQTTANCYVISHPGSYKIPLVYGNAIKNGATNSIAYDPTGGGVSGLAHLDPFVNYKGTGITNPWLKTDGTPTSAELVWTDSRALYNLLNGKFQISGDYILFDATDTENLSQGNAVVAVKDQNGDVMWSWQLWFAPDNVLDEIKVVNFRERLAIRSTYYYTTETLGYRAGTYYGTTYAVPRKIRATIEQAENAPGEAAKTAVLYLTQNPQASEQPAQYTLYQWGRKDAMPGSDIFYPETGFDKAGAGPVDYATAIKNPGVFYVKPTGADGVWCTTIYGNAWSSNASNNGNNWQYVYKTVYDPSPQGFRMPQPTAFNWLEYNPTYNYQDGTVSTSGNVVGSWNDGLNFRTEKNGSNTFFMPACGMRNINTGEYKRTESSQGSINTGGSTGHYWSAFFQSRSTAYSLYFGKDYIYCAATGFNISSGFAVRPVKE